MTRQASETIPPVDALVRWINLMSLALAVGSIGFVCFVWQPALAEADRQMYHEKRSRKDSRGQTPRPPAWAEKFAATTLQ